MRGESHLSTSSSSRGSSVRRDRSSSIAALTFAASFVRSAPAFSKSSARSSRFTWRAISANFLRMPPSMPREDCPSNLVLLRYRTTQSRAASPSNQARMAASDDASGKAPGAPGTATGSVEVWTIFTALTLPVVHVYCDKDSYHNRRIERQGLDADAVHLVTSNVPPTLRQRRSGWRIPRRRSRLRTWMARRAEGLLECRQSDRNPALPPATRSAGCDPLLSFSSALRARAMQRLRSAMAAPSTHGLGRSAVIRAPEPSRS